MPDHRADDDREPKGGWPSSVLGPCDQDRYEVTGGVVAGYPAGTILRRDQLLPFSATIQTLLELGVIRPVPDGG